MYFGVFQGLTVVFRSPEDPEILLLSGADWRDETPELVKMDFTGLFRLDECIEPDSI